MFRQPMHLELIFVLLLQIRLIFVVDASKDICFGCTCDSLTYSVFCQKRNLVSFPERIITKLSRRLELGENNITNIDIRNIEDFKGLLILNVSYNKIKSIKKGTFNGLANLRELNLAHNEIDSIEDKSFEGLDLLETLFLNSNALVSISSNVFPHMRSLTTLDLSNNRIHRYADGAFLFLHKLTTIRLIGNNQMSCECHLPALVNYTKKAFNRRLEVLGTCDLSGHNITILEYSQCQDYSLFQRDLQCQSCEGTTCDDSDVAKCSGNESVCMTNRSMSGVTLKVIRSCRTYKECMENEANKLKTCAKWADDTICADCCSGNLCNKHHFVGWSFVFDLVYKRNSTSKTNSIEMAEAMEDELSHIKGTFKVKYCGLVKDMEIFTIHCTVLKDNIKDDVRMNIYKILFHSQKLQDKRFPKNSMQLITEKICIEDTTSNDHEIFIWPQTKVGATANVPCFSNKATRKCSTGRLAHLKAPTNQSMTSLKCSSFLGVWQEPDMSQCNYTKWVTENLEKLENQDINRGNINIDVLKEFVNISQTSKYFKKENIGSSVSILEKLLKSMSMSRASTEAILDDISAIVNNIMNAQLQVWAEAEQDKRSVSRMLKIIDVIPEMILPKEKEITISYPNFGFGVSKVDSDTFNGFSSRISFSNTASNITVHNSSYQVGRGQDAERSNYISLPKSLLDQLNDEQRLNVSRVIFSYMRDGKLYRAILLNSNSETKAKFNSNIISARIPKISVTELQEPVTISFILLDKKTHNLQCVYWDKTPGEDPQWSTKGCSTSYNDTEKTVLCSCNHLTSFALLMDFYQKEGSKKNNKYLSIISSIGCGISFACLIITIIIHVSLKKLKKLFSSKILICLCSSLAVTNFIFLVGMQTHVVKSIGLCKAVAAALHYSLLASLMWMSIEAVDVFLGLVIVFKTYQTDFLMRASILAWGLPALIVILTLSINHTNNYTRSVGVCWLSDTPFYVALLTPVAIILASNLILFLYIIVRVATRKNFSHATQRTRKIQIWGVVGLFFLLGLNWIIAIFPFHEAEEVFRYLFVIFNTFQGMFIFIFYSIYKKDTRNIICEFIRYKRKRFAEKDNTHDTMGSEGGKTES